MSPKMTSVALAIATVGMFSGVPAWSQAATSTTTTQQRLTSTPEVKLAAQYTTLAGSPRNAESLIIGLRDGKNILLINSSISPNPTAPSITFTPPTGKLGYGNINIALSLAKADLAKLGITNPTPAQLAAALNGGTITVANGTATMAGVLAQRQSGLGWGQIANAMGVKLGAVVSASKTDKAGKKNDFASTAKNSVEPGSQGKSEQARGSNNGNKSDSGTRSSNSAGGGNSGGGGGRSK